MSNDAPPLTDPKLLQLFDVLYGARSVTRAAEQLGMSQPTVSIWLAQLRLQLRDPLFIRTPSGMQPTPQADAMIGQVREVLEALRRLSAWEQAFVPATAQRRFRICMTDASLITLLPMMLAHVRATAPQVRLEATRIDRHTAQALESGEADLAVGHAPWLESGIYQQTLFPQDWVCLVNRSHPRIAQVLGLAEYRREAHIAIAAGTAYQLLEGALTSQNIRRRVGLELPGFLGLVAMVSQTDLIVTLPRHIAETLSRLGELAVFDCPFAVPSFDVKQHWHARYHQDPGNRWFRGVMASLFLKGDRGVPGDDPDREAMATAQPI
jgi:DNA-binding transcriptional LysR family regulator